MTAPKSQLVGKNDPPRDPHLTPWEEDEAEMGVPVRRPRGRSMRDWIVIGAAALLFTYVLLFLFVGPSTGTGSPTRGNTSLFGGGTIALIPLHGEISASTGSDTIGYPDVVAALDAAENDPSVQAIFLDVDSGGGSVVASKQIVAKLRSLRKPTITWIGEVGASGAYYAASATSFIMADSDSITGSIGVISRQQNVKDLLDKLGIKTEDITTGPYKAIGSPYKDMNADERELFQVLVNQAFEGFKSDVQSFRGDKLKHPAFEDVLDGRILSGKQALDIGLIDATGTREDALKKAAELGKIEGTPDYKNFIEKPFTLSDFLFSAGSQFGKGFKAAWTADASTASIDAK